MIRNILNKNKKSKISARAIALMALFLMPGLIMPNLTFAMSEEEARQELNRINRENQQLNNQAKQKQQEANTLSGQIADLNSKIGQTQSEIYSVNNKINKLAKDIQNTESEIKLEEKKLSERQQQLGVFIKEVYEEGQQSYLELIARSESFSDFVNRSEYLEQIQLRVKAETDRIIELRNALNSKREKMAVDKAETEKAKKTLLSRQSEIASQRSAQSYLLSMTEAEKQSYEKEISNNNSRKGLLWCIIYGGCGSNDADGDIVVTNSFFTYYSQLQSPWASYIYDKKCSDCTIRNYGCLITSLSMVRTSFGIPTNPIQEAQKHSYTNGYMNYWDFAGKPRISIGKASIKSKLEAGRPVIVELNMGAYHHFIALFAAEGDTFYANDPAFSSGKTYSLSRVVSAYSY